MYTYISGQRKKNNYKYITCNVDQIYLSTYEIIFISNFSL